MGLRDLSLGPIRCKLERNMFFFSDYWHMELLIILRFHLRLTWEQVTALMYLEKWGFTEA